MGWDSRDALGFRASLSLNKENRSKRVCEDIVHTSRVCLLKLRVKICGSVGFTNLAQPLSRFDSVANSNNELLAGNNSERGRRVGCVELIWRPVSTLTGS